LVGPETVTHKSIFKERRPAYPIPIPQAHSWMRKCWSARVLWPAWTPAAGLESCPTSARLIARPCCAKPWGPQRASPARAGPRSAWRASGSSIATSPRSRIRWPRFPAQVGRSRGASPHLAGACTPIPFRLLLLRRHRTNASVNMHKVVISPRPAGSGSGVFCLGPLGNRS
jgi:hypothetical protein